MSLTAQERDRLLEMRLRVSQKLVDVLEAEIEAAPGHFDALEGARILGMTLGLGLAGAPSNEARMHAANAHRLGVEQAMQLREAVDMMKIGPTE